MNSFAHPGHGHNQKLDAEKIGKDLFILNKSQSRICDPSVNNCTIIKNYPGKQTSDNPLCEEYWKHSKTSKSNLNSCNTNKDRFSEGHIPESQNSMQNMGLQTLTNRTNNKDERSLNKKKMAEIESEAREVMDSVASSCCTKDQACIKNMKSIEIKFCTPPTNPNEPDPCTNEAYYTLKDQQISQLKNSMYKKYVANNMENSKDAQEVRRIVSMLYNESDSSLLKDLKSSFISLPIAGRVVFSPYVSEMATANIRKAVATHEFFHACDMVKAQNKLFNEQNDMKIVLQNIRRIHNFLSNDCKLDESIKSSYQNLWSEMGESTELAKCIEQLATDSTKLNSKSFCSDACPSRILAEGFAHAASLIVATGEVSKQLYPAGCHSPSDKLHPLTADLIECVAQHSPRFKKIFKSTYNCI